MGNQVIILACIGTFNPDLITAKLAPVLTEAGLQIEGGSTVYDGHHYLAIGRPDDLNAALDRLNVSRVLAPEKKEGGPPQAGQQSTATGPEDQDGPSGHSDPAGDPGPDGGNAEPPPPPESETQPPQPPQPPCCE